MALAAVLVTAGCGPASTPGESTSPSVSVDACDSDPTAALQDAIDEVDGPESGWSAEASDISGYDACRVLSWMVLKTDATEQGPEQVAFFYLGSFSGTAYDEYFSYPTSVEMIDETTVTVTWTYPEAVDRNGEKRTESMSTYTWSDQTFSVEREGELPPYAEGDDWNNNGPAPSN